MADVDIGSKGGGNASGVWVQTDNKSVNIGQNNQSSGKIGGGTDSISASDEKLTFGHGDKAVSVARHDNGDVRVSMKKPIEADSYLADMTGGKVNDDGHLVVPKGRITDLPDALDNLVHEGNKPALNSFVIDGKTGTASSFSATTEITRVSEAKGDIVGGIKVIHHTVEDGKHNVTIALTKSGDIHISDISRDGNFKETLSAADVATNGKAVEQLLDKLPKGIRETVAKGMVAAEEIMEKLPKPVQHIVKKAAIIVEAATSGANMAFALSKGDFAQAEQQIEKMAVNGINGTVGIVDIAGVTGDDVGTKVVETAKEKGLSEGLKAGWEAADKGLNETRGQVTDWLVAHNGVVNGVNDTRLAVASQVSDFAFEKTHGQDTKTQAVAQAAPALTPIQKALAAAGECKVAGVKCTDMNPNHDTKTAQTFGQGPTKQVVGVGSVG